MPSKNPTIAVRLPPGMYAQVRERAAQEHRSLSNFIEHHLRRLIGPDNESAFKEIAASEAARGQVDIETAIAQAAKRRPSKSTKHK